MDAHNGHMPTTTIALDAKTRDRLRTFGHAGLNFDQILQRLMDEVDRERYVAELHRQADAETNWTALEDFDWGQS
jgi:hypothetical protein